MSTAAPSRPLRDHLIGVAALLAGLALFIAGTPGARGLSRSLVDGEGRAEVERRAGVAAPVVLAIYRLNFDLRVPVAKHLIPVQSLFRVSQSWGLYGGGPKQIRWLRIDVDGQPVFRTEDPDLTWRAPQFSHRKMRPMVETMSNKASAYNWTGFSRWVLREVRRDFPDARHVSIVAERAERTPGAPVEEHHWREASAPDWSWQSFDKRGMPVELAEEDTP